LPGKPKDLVLKVFVISDFVKFEMSPTEVEFGPTMMFEKRVTQATITNTSQIRFDYKWLATKFVSLWTDYSATRPCAFSVQPSAGFVDPGQTTTFQVQFAPEDVDDFSAVLVCDIPHITRGMEPPTIQVSGRSKRPLCHFNLETSDYLTAGRRRPDTGEPLPEGVRVIELFSKGIGQKTIKRFEVINTTETSYEIGWVAKTPHQAIVCETPVVMISSGRRHIAAFSYAPASVKTVEALWEFRIPEFGVNVPLLVVGRIMPH
jgi:hydrocephalus-inducing protein